MMESPHIFVTNELFAQAESSYFTGNYQLETFATGPDVYTFQEPLRWEVSVTNTGDALLVSGSVEGTASTLCARCLEPFTFDIAGEVEGYYLLPNTQEEPKDLDADEFEWLPEDKTIDLSVPIKAALLIEFPLVPLCAEDCLGLCKKCGNPLREGNCECEEAEEVSVQKSNPFSVLKDYDFGGE